MKDKICDWCQKPGAITYHQRTQYEKKEENHVTLCPECREENDKYWNEMWDEYYKNCM